MHTSYFIYFSLISGLILVMGAVCYAFACLGKHWSIKTLFKDFKRKIIMTLSLGFVFSLVYLAGVVISAYLIKLWGADLIFLLKDHTVEFIYGGLFLFICLSLSTYFIRMLVKYFYLTRGKDS